MFLLWEVSNRMVKVGKWTIPLAYVVLFGVGLALPGGAKGAQGEEVPSTEKILDNMVETLEFHEANVMDILRLLARQNNLNLIIAPDSMGKISFKFSKVTLRTALDVILRAKGFQYEIYDNILLITSPDTLERQRGLGLETQIFTLKYADGRDIKATIDSMRVLSPYGNITAHSRSVAQDAVRASGLAGGELAAGGTGVGQLKARPDVLLVTDKPPHLKKVAAIIAQLDKPQRQVAIDVQFVEVVLGKDQTIGINWEGLLSAQGSYQGRMSWQLGGDPASLVQGGAVQFGSLANTRFSAILQMLLQTDKARLLSQPRLTTLENQPAIISVGTTVWIQQVQAAGGVTGQQAITFQERRIPIELVVVPHILEGNRVMLELRPRVEEIVGWQELPAVGRLPIISTRVSDSRVEVNDGETAVIAGLIKDRTTWNEKRVWLLSSLPLIGHLFRYRTEETEKTELSIFITPRILEPGSTLAKLEPVPPPEAFSTPSPPEERESLPGRIEARSTPPTKEALPDTQKSKTKTDQRGSPSPPPSTKGASPPLSFSTPDYFPLAVGRSWQFLWKGKEDERWESTMKVIKGNGEWFWVEEDIPAGRYKSRAYTRYGWLPTGLVNTAKVVGTDTTLFLPDRLILPRDIEQGREYQTRYRQKEVRKEVQGAEKEIVQVQKLIAKQGVTTPLGRYPDCLVVETITYEPQAPNETRRRKVVWYARGLGPVKIEADIPLNAAELKGVVSGYLARGTQ